MTDSISDTLKRYPKAGLIKSPLLIHRLPRLSSLTGKSVFIMRDDLTGFALGGNKTRKLEYLIGDALAKKADTLITMGASSFSRNAAAAGKVYGFDVNVLLAGSEKDQNRASQAFFKQYDTQLHYVTMDRENALDDACSRLVELLQGKGKAVYKLHPGGSDTIGALGYLDVFSQILDYSRLRSVHFHKIIHASGSTGTQAGLLLGQSLSGYDTKVVGMAISQKTAVQTERVLELYSKTAQMLEVQYDDTLVLVDDRFIGLGYNHSSEDGMIAVEMFATMEGIQLDQIYTGKAAAGLLYHAKKEMCDGENVLFIHTGGNADLYCAMETKKPEPL